MEGRGTRAKREVTELRGWAGQGAGKSYSQIPSTRLGEARGKKGWILKNVENIIEIGSLWLATIPLWKNSILLGGHVLYTGGVEKHIFQPTHLSHLAGIPAQPSLLGRRSV